MKKPQVSIMMGSDSDLKTMEQAVDILKKFKIPYEVKILSAHRTPADTIKFASSAASRGVKAIIAGAGGAAHLAGVVAAHTTLPVIGVPIETRSLAGIDSLFSTVQMPGGIPVGTMAIGKSGAKNAGIFAAEIVANGDKAVQKKLQAFKKEMASKVRKKQKLLKRI
jgi:phosphoribosylaminoimidazole carboxylase PurE protein